MTTMPKAFCKECGEVMDKLRTECCMGYCAACLSLRCAGCGVKLEEQRLELQNLPSAAKHYCDACWAVKNEELEESMGVRPRTLIVTPYPDYVTYLKKQKIVGENVQVCALANNKNVKGRVVVCADLPLRLAVLAHSIIMVSLKMTDKDKHTAVIKEERIAEIARKPRRFKITEIT